MSATLFPADDPTVRKWDIPLKAGELILEVLTAPGSAYVITILKTVWHDGGNYPGLQFQVLHSLDQAHGLEQYIRYSVIRALRRDGVPESKAMPIHTQFTDTIKMITVATIDELTAIARSLQSAVAVAKQGR